MSRNTLNFVRALLPLAIAACVVGCAKPTMPSAPASEIVKANFDPSTPACTDFYTHANGGWLSKNPVPSDQTSWGSFNVLADRVTLDLRVIVDAAAVNNAATGNEKMVGDYYGAAMDEAKIEELGVKPLAANLARIDSLKNTSDLSRYIREEQARAGVLFNFYGNGDFKNPEMVIGYAGQGGLGLPERDYYLRPDADSQKLLSQYQAHIALMLVLSGRTALDANQAAANIVAFETRLAKVSLTRLEQRDPATQYRLISVLDANKETPNFNWSALFDSLLNRIP